MLQAGRNPKSTQHRAAVRKTSQSKQIHGGLGMDLDKAKMIQDKIDELVKHMVDLLRIERDAELEYTQEELNAVSSPDEESDASKPIEYLVSHGQAQQEQCDTICNLNTVSSSTGKRLLVTSGSVRSPIYQAYLKRSKVLSTQLDQILHVGTL